jgi:thiol-disulfide isomerase/thioredoxin
LNKNRSNTSKLTALLVVAVVALVAVIVAVGLQEARRTSSGTDTGAGTVLGPSSLGTGYVVHPFSAKDLNGHTVDNSFFANQRLTMVDVWGTFCGPCIREMPDLAQLPSVFPSTDFAILGIIVDTSSEVNDANKATEATARQLVSTAGATYMNVIPDKAIMNELLAGVSVVPTTFFVDRTGTVVGTVLTGSRSKAEWTGIIQGVLANLPAGS